MTATDNAAHDRARLFDELAEGYDRAALRFFPFVADRLADRLAPGSGEKVLDVATGTGAVAVAIGQRIRGDGRVMAIDISERMLDRAYANVRRMALRNVDLHRMDASNLEFRTGYFDALTCSFGLFFLPDMPAALREWQRVLRPGAKLHVTSFGGGAFQPLLGDFFAQLVQARGPGLAERAVPWAALSDPAVMSELLTASGFDEVLVETEQFGFHLQTPEEWWDVLWYTGFRDALRALDERGLDQFRLDHLDTIARRFVDGKFWLNVPVIFGGARVPR